MLAQARALLAPTMQPMPEDIAATLREAIDAQDRGYLDLASDGFRVAPRLAAGQGYL